MVNQFWSDPFGYTGRPNVPNNVQQLPTITNPTQYEQPRVSPTRHYMQRNVSNTVVPNVHPSHLTTVNEYYRHNQHYFPHTTSQVNCCYEMDQMCGTPFHPPNCGCRRKR
ncbi:MAG: CotD family spore coat protein [Lysinibacillus sp.]